MLVAGSCRWSLNHRFFIERVQSLCEFHPPAFCHIINSFQESEFESEFLSFNSHQYHSRQSETMSVGVIARCTRLRLSQSQKNSGRFAHRNEGRTAVPKMQLYHFQSQNVARLQMVWQYAVTNVINNNYYYYVISFVVDVVLMLISNGKQLKGRTGSRSHHRDSRHHLPLPFSNFLTITHHNAFTEFTPATCNL